MRVLMLSLDRGLLGERGSGDVAERHQRYADLAGALDVIVFAPEAREKVWSGNFRVFAAGSSKIGHFRGAAKLAEKLASRSGYDLLVTQDFAAPAGTRIKERLGLPWIVNVHGMFFENSWLGFSVAKWYLYCRIRSAIRKADAFRVNNVTIQDRLRAWGIEKPILVQPTPIDISKFRNIEIKKSSDTVSVLYVGRLSPEKNVAMLIRAFREIRIENLELRIVGKGPEERSLKALAVGDARIKFVGIKSLDELPAIYHGADILVLPSNTESFGKVLIEAGAVGCALIATATAGAKSILGDSENGILVPVGSQQALEEALTNLVTKTFEREYWGKQALALADKYDGAAGIQKTVEFWNKIAKL